MTDEPTIGETIDKHAVLVVLPLRVWREKIVKGHPEMEPYLVEVLSAVAKPDHTAPDLIFEGRTRYYSRKTGPSRWLLVVVSYEQVPARIVSAFATPEGPQVMEPVNIKIGRLSFDHADYDSENDVLYLHVGEPQVGEGEETPEGHVIRYAPGTGRVIGLTMMGPRRALARDGHLMVTVPETVETTADDLAPALAAL